MALGNNAMRVERRSSDRTSVDAERAKNLAGEPEPLRIEPLVNADDVNLGRLIARDGCVEETTCQVNESRIVILGERDHAPNILLTRP